MIGETLGSYRVTEKIGEGGMGVVYAAVHPLIGRKAAVKLLLPELSRNAEMVNRFFNEARATTLIGHSGLVDIFDFGFHPSGAYIVMEFLEGESLASNLRRDAFMTPPRIVALGRQLASALAAAHKKSIVHRDLKPDNVFLVADPDIAGGQRVKILDFGIAKLAGESAKPSVRTRTGSMMGTPLYMSPEQCRGAGLVDQRSDIYALGCILFEMACGRPPFLGEGSGDLIVAHLREAPPRPTALNPGLPPELAAGILRMLEKNVNDRPQSMDDVGTWLEACGGGPLGYPIGHSTGSPARVPGHPGTTTLGASVGEAGPARRARQGWVMPAAGAGLAALISVAFVATRGGSGEDAAGQPAITPAAASAGTRPGSAALPGPPVLSRPVTARVASMDGGAPGAPSPPTFEPAVAAPADGGPSLTPEPTSLPKPSRPTHARTSRRTPHTTSTRPPSPPAAKPPSRTTRSTRSVPSPS